MRQYIGSRHWIETRVVRDDRFLILVASFVDGGILRITVRLISGVEEVIDCGTYGDLFHGWQFKAIRQTEMVYKIGIERILVYTEVIELLAADIL